MRKPNVKSSLGREDLSPSIWSRMTPEERVNLAIHMSSVVARVSIDSIRDRHPKWSEEKVLKEARRRIALGRRVHPEG